MSEIKDDLEETNEKKQPESCAGNYGDGDYEKFATKKTGSKTDLDAKNMIKQVMSKNKNKPKAYSEVNKANFEVVKDYSEVGKAFSKVDKADSEVVKDYSKVDKADSEVKNSSFVKNKADEINSTNKLKAQEKTIIEGQDFAGTRAQPEVEDHDKIKMKASSRNKNCAEDSPKNILAKNDKLEDIALEVAKVSID